MLADHGLEARTVEVERVFSSDEEKATLSLQLKKLHELGIEDSNECLNYLIQSKTNPGEAPAFERVLSAAAEFKAAGVEESKLLLFADMQAKKEEMAEEMGKQEQKEIETERDFLGVNWSLGIAMSVDLSGDERIESAEVVNGVVRVTEESSNSVGFFWEVHKYWWNDKGWCLEEGCDRTNLEETRKFATWGLGPFVGITTTQDDLIDTFSIGLMYGRRITKDQDVSLNLGLGLIYEPDVQILGDGIVADEPLPEGETDIRFKKEDRWGALLAVSFRF
jgi:hypothetical protein